MPGYFYQEPFTGVVLLHIPAQPASAWVSQWLLRTASLLSQNTPGASLKASCLHCVMPQNRMAGPTGLQVAENKQHANHPAPRL